MNDIGRKREIERKKTRVYKSCVSVPMLAEPDQFDKVSYVYRPIGLAYQNHQL